MIDTDYLRRIKAEVEFVEAQDVPPGYANMMLSLDKMRFLLNTITELQTQTEADDRYIRLIERGRREERERFLRIIAA